MNIAAVISASIFVILSVAALIFLFVGKNSFSSGKYKVFYRACCGVYVSGTLLVLLFSLIMKGLPVAFVIISDITITCVFAFTAGLIYFMTKSIVEAASKSDRKTEDEKEKN